MNTLWVACTEQLANWKLCQAHGQQSENGSESDLASLCRTHNSNDGFGLLTAVL
jgi:hypothetical protein